MNLREKHGYTYGAHSGFNFLRAPGPFSISTSVRTNVTGPAISEIFKELDGIHTNALSKDELRMAKDNIALSLPGLFETSSGVAQATSNLFIYNLPLDYYRRLPAQIDATTADEVQRVVQKYLNPESMPIVVVGDKAKILPEIQKLNLGQMQELDFECNPVK
jgi:zinc protease